MLDNLFKGRFRLGMGRGLARREFAAFRLSMDKSCRRFDEAAPMIVNAWPKLHDRSQEKRIAYG